MDISNIKLEKCTLEDYPDLLKILDKEFEKDCEHWFIKNLLNIFPRLEEKNIEKISRHMMMKNGNDIIGIIGIYPLKFKVKYNNKTEELNVGGIGSVSVASNYRKQGVMSNMLKQAIELMENQNFDLSWLSGNRFRYGNYGWNLSGKYYTIKIEYKDLLRYKFDKLNLSIKKPNKTDIPILDSLYSDLSCCQLRNKSIWVDQIERRNYNWLLANNNKDYGYLVSSKENMNYICEIQGNSEVISNLILKYMENNNLKYVQINYPCKQDTLLDSLMNKASYYSQSLNGLLKVINVENTWVKLFSLLKQQPVYKFNKEYFDKINKNNDVETKRIIINKMLDIYCPNNSSEIINNIQSINWWMSDVDKV